MADLTESESDLVGTWLSPLQTGLYCRRSARDSAILT